jgi:D-3-phosphoglycerate dehydrogenase
MPKKVLISDRVDPVCTDLLEEHGYTPNVQLGKSNDELKEHVASAVAWIVRSGTTVTDEMMEAAADLQVIGRAGVGVDNIDTDAATRRGLLVINAPDGNTISTAEHACAMTMALMREIPQAHSSLAGGKWERKSFMGAEVYGKTLGVVGVGKIGREVARRMASFEMDVLGHDPVLSEEMAERLGVELVSFDELCERSDVITVHTPLNDSTRGLIDGSRLKQCKPGVRIVNCARGGIVDEEDLLEALANEQVGGAALDVYSEEPPPDALDDLISHPRVVATPHIAASTGEAQAKVARQITEQVIRALEDRPVSTPVNGMAIRMAGEPEVQPYLRLADRLGQVAGQLEDGPLERATVRCHGETPHRYADVLAIAALKGVLSRWVDAPVNMINAPVLADEHGVRLEEQRGSATGGGLANQIEVVLNGADGDDEQRLVAGTLFAGDDPRLVRVDDYDGLEVRPEGRLLVYRNEDRPGMLASVGKILAEAGINIGALALGRREKGSTALTVVSVDEPVSADVLDRVSEVEGVRRARLVRFDQ